MSEIPRRRDEINSHIRSSLVVSCAVGVGAFFAMVGFVTIYGFANIWVPALVGVAFAVHRAVKLFNEWVRCPWCKYPLRGSVDFRRLRLSEKVRRCPGCRREFEPRSIA